MRGRLDFLSAARRVVARLNGGAVLSGAVLGGAVLVTSGLFGGLLSGCYLSHTRPEADGGSPITGDASRPDATEDARVEEDGGSVPLLPHTGCRVECDEPELRAWVGFTDTMDVDDAPRRFVSAHLRGDELVVLMTRPHLGHISPAHRPVFFDTLTGDVRFGQAWSGPARFAQHHDGLIVIPSPSETLRVLALTGRPEWAGPLSPTGDQWVGLFLLEWSVDDGTLRSAIKLTERPGAATEGCPGGCEAALTLDGDRAVLTYAPDGQLQRLVVDLSGEPVAGEWEVVGEIEDMQRAPWPHVAEVVNGERWIAGGGTAEFEPPRSAFLIGPTGTTALPGTQHDPPPHLLGGSELVMARFVADERGFVVTRPGRDEEVVVPIGLGAAPLSSHLSRARGDRALLAWATHAPGSFRDTQVSLTPDVPESLCSEVRPATVIRVPESVAHPSVLAHEHQGTTYLFTLPDGPSGDEPQLAVFAIERCALVP